MADLSKIKVDKTVYALKDATARSNIAAITKLEEVYSSDQPAATTQATGAFWTQIISE